MAEPGTPEPQSAPDAGAASPRRRRSHRGWVNAMLVLAVISGVIAVFSLWVKRQVLETNNWANTSSKLLADPKIQDAVGAYMVNELFSNVNVAGELRSALPPRVQGLAGPAAGGLQQLADRAAPELLARPRVQDAWRTANVVAHRQLIRILNGGGNTVSTKNGEVVLNLRPLVTQLAASLGLQNQLAAARAKLTPAARAQARGVAQSKLGAPLPTTTGQLVIMRSNELKTAQNVTKAIRDVSIISTIVSLGLFALAVWLAQGWRRVALRRVGWSFIGIGLFALVLRRFAGNHVVNGLVSAESVKPAAHDAWLIGTSLLRAIAIALVIYGLLLVVAAWLAGSTRPAVGLRRALAPTLRDHPVRVYIGVAVVYLLVLLWGPTPALRRPLPILLIAALLVLGIEALRHLAAREFPDAHAGDAMQRLRTWYDGRRGRGAPEAAPVADGGGDGVRLSQLERLASLHDNGALTDEEYASQKGLLLRS